MKKLKHMAVGILMGLTVNGCYKDRYDNCQNVVENPVDTIALKGRIFGDSILLNYYSGEFYNAAKRRGNADALEPIVDETEIHTSNWLKRLDTLRIERARK